jgi:hypothetical protein
MKGVIEFASGMYVMLTTLKLWKKFQNYLFKLGFDEHSYSIFMEYSRVRFLAGAGNFSLHHRVQNGSGAHPASYPMGTRGSFPGGKAAGS